MHCIDFPVVLVDVYYHMPQRRVEEEHLFDARRVSYYSFLKLAYVTCEQVQASLFCPQAGFLKNFLLLACMGL